MVAAPITEAQRYLPDLDLTSMVKNWLALGLEVPQSLLALLKAPTSHRDLKERNSAPYGDARHINPSLWLTGDHERHGMHPLSKGVRQEVVQKREEN